MKKLFLTFGILVVLALSQAQAQSIVQLTTQLALDIEKLSELKNILNDLYKGYEIVDKGYSTIKNIVSGNYDLHKAFLDGLLAVSPAVQNYQRVVDVINSEEELVKEYTTAGAQFRSSGVFTSSELDYIGKQYSTLLSLSLKDLDELTKVLTSNELRMSDYERISAIDRIASGMDDKLAFLRAFNSNTSVQALQRQRDLNDIGTVRGLFGISK